MEQTTKTQGLNTEMNELKKLLINGNFYIGFSIDHMFFDSNSLSYFHGPFGDHMEEPRFKTSSIEAFNTLIESLEQFFNVRLVVTSRRRENMEKCIAYLKREGLKYNKPIFHTPFNSDTSRGEKFVNFIKEDGKSNLSYPSRNIVSKLLYRLHNNDFQNYVVLDSDPRLISSAIPPDRRIITSKKALTMKQVENFLKANNIPIKQKNNPESEQSFE